MFLRVLHGLSYLILSTHPMRYVLILPYYFTDDIETQGIKQFVLDQTAKKMTESEFKHKSSVS